MKMAEELRQYGCSMEPEAFRDLVVELHQLLHPSWTDEQLLFHPYNAMQFCEAVRQKTQQWVPDHFVLRTLINCRKRGDR